jgi:hypothetical protein
MLKKMLRIIDFRSSRMDTKYQRKKYLTYGFHINDFSISAISYLNYIFAIAKIFTHKNIHYAIYENNTRRFCND